MRAGKLIHRVTIQQLSTTVDDAGQPEGFETFAANVCARVYESPGSESRNDNRTVDSGASKICLRYREGLKASMRVVHGERTYEIKSLSNPDGKRIEHELICEVVSNA